MAPPAESSLRAGNAVPSTSADLTQSAQETTGGNATMVEMAVVMSTLAMDRVETMLQGLRARGRRRAVRSAPLTLERPFVRSPVPHTARGASPEPRTAMDHSPHPRSLLSTSLPLLSGDTSAEGSHNSSSNGLSTARRLSPLSGSQTDARKPTPAEQWKTVKPGPGPRIVPKVKSSTTTAVANTPTHLADALWNDLLRAAEDESVATHPAAAGLEDKQQQPAASASTSPATPPQSARSSGFSTARAPTSPTSVRSSGFPTAREPSARSPVPATARGYPSFRSPATGAQGRNSSEAALPSRSPTLSTARENDALRTACSPALARQTISNARPGYGTTMTPPVSPRPGFITARSPAPTTARENDALRTARSPAMARQTISNAQPGFMNPSVSPFVNAHSPGLSSAREPTAHSSGYPTAKEPSFLVSARSPAPTTARENDALRTARSPALARQTISHARPGMRTPPVSPSRPLHQPNQFTARSPFTQRSPQPLTIDPLKTARSPGAGIQTISNARPGFLTPPLSPFSSGFPTAREPSLRSARSPTPENALKTARSPVAAIQTISNARPGHPSPPVSPFVNAHSPGLSSAREPTAHSSGYPTAKEPSFLVSARSPAPTTARENDALRTARSPAMARQTISHAQPGYGSTITPPISPRPAFATARSPASTTACENDALRTACSPALARQTISNARPGYGTTMTPPVSPRPGFITARSPAPTTARENDALRTACSPAMARQTISKALPGSATPPSTPEVQSVGAFVFPPSDSRSSGLPTARQPTAQSSGYPTAQEPSARSVRYPSLHSARSPSSATARENDGLRTARSPAVARQTISYARPGIFDTPSQYAMEESPVNTCRPVSPSVSLTNVHTAPSSSPSEEGMATANSISRTDTAFSPGVVTEEKLNLQTGRSPVTGSVLKTALSPAPTSSDKPTSFANEPATLRNVPPLSRSPFGVRSPAPGSALKTARSPALAIQSISNARPGAPSSATSPAPSSRFSGFPTAREPTAQQPSLRSGREPSQRSLLSARSPAPMTARKNDTLKTARSPASTRQTGLTPPLAPEVQSVGSVRFAELKKAHEGPQNPSASLLVSDREAFRTARSPGFTVPVGRPVSATSNRETRNPGPVRVGSPFKPFKTARSPAAITSGQRPPPASPRPSSIGSNIVDGRSGVSGRVDSSTKGVRTSCAPTDPACHSVTCAPPAASARTPTAQLQAAKNSLARDRVPLSQRSSGPPTGREPSQRSTRSPRNLTGRAALPPILPAPGTGRTSGPFNRSFSVARAPSTASTCSSGLPTAREASQRSLVSARSPAPTTARELDALRTARSPALARQTISNARSGQNALNTPPPTGTPRPSLSPAPCTARENEALRTGRSPASAVQTISNAGLPPRSPWRSGASSATPGTLSGRKPFSQLASAKSPARPHTMREVRPNSPTLKTVPTTRSPMAGLSPTVPDTHLELTQKPVKSPAQLSEQSQQLLAGRLFSPNVAPTEDLGSRLVKSPLFDYKTAASKSETENLKSGATRSRRAFGAPPAVPLNSTTTCPSSNSVRTARSVTRGFATSPATNRARSPADATQRSTVVPTARPSLNTMTPPADMFPALDPQMIPRRIIIEQDPAPTQNACSPLLPSNAVVSPNVGSALPANSSSVDSSTSTDSTEIDGVDRVTVYSSDSTESIHSQMSMELNNNIPDPSTTSGSKRRLRPSRILVNGKEVWKKEERK